MTKQAGEIPYYTVTKKNGVGQRFLTNTFQGIMMNEEMKEPKVCTVRDLFSKKQPIKYYIFPMGSYICVYICEQVCVWRGV